MPRIRFEPDGQEIEVPIGTSVLEAARKAHAMVGSACGGVCACSTCHVYVRDGLAQMSELGEREEDILDKAFDVRASSRLSCQARLVAERGYVVELTRETRKAFLDEHPEERARWEAAQRAGATGGPGAGEPA